ncbi:MAG: TonB-dependent receptor [Bacteroidales bacterium]|nr:MAG: TonB-dependent receptor [Bacteroidales bacterium]
MKKRLVFFGMFFFLCSFTALAQTRQITGTVTSSDDGKGIPGVSVVVKGTTTGIQTDLDGKYSLNVPADATVLVFSFIGLKTQEVTISGDVINAVMEPEALTIGELVVVGYGTTTKEATTGSIQKVGGEKIEKMSITSLEQALQGNAVGVKMTSLDGQPGAAVNVRVRGVGSISAGRGPLYVIDGVVVLSGSAASGNDIDNDGTSSNAMSTINPNDIASLTVLKDASATAIYGSRAANGVILITTKSGKAGKGKIKVSSSYGVSSYAVDDILPTSMNAAQYEEYFVHMSLISTNASFRVATEDLARERFRAVFPYADRANTNWVEELKKTGITKDLNISAEGGNENVSYFSSLSYNDQKGVMLGTSHERIAGRLNLKAKINERVSVDNNMSLSQTLQNVVKDQTGFNNPVYGQLFLPAIIPVHGDDGKAYYGHQFYGAYKIMSGNNYVGQYEDDERWIKQQRVMDNVAVTVNIIDGLKFKTAWSVDLLGVREFSYENPFGGDGYTNKGQGVEAATNRINWTGTETLDYNKVFGKHSIGVLVGYEATKTSTRLNTAAGNTYAHPDLHTLSTAAVPTTASSSLLENAMVSLFSRITYNFNSKYYVNLSYRRDGSSRFGSEKRWGNFYSIGASWRLHEESFIKDINFIDELKLRASYGITGNESIGNYVWRSTYTAGVTYNDVPGTVPTVPGNNKLTWETQNTTDIGFDLGLFKRVSIDFTYYNRLNSELIFPKPVSYSTGFSTITANVADMQNRGIELTLSGDIIKTKAITWSANFNISKNKNEIVSIPGEPYMYNDYQRHEEGKDFSSFYLYHWAGVDVGSGLPLWYTDETKTNVTSDITKAKQFYTNTKASPDLYGGFGTSISWKGLTLDVAFAYSFGNYVYEKMARFNQSEGAYFPRATAAEVWEGRWQKPGDITKYPRFAPTAEANKDFSTRYLYDASFIRLRNLNLSYQFDSKLVKKVKLSSASIYLRAQNFWTWVRDKDLYFDPEQADNGFTGGFQPQSKTISVGIELEF